MSEGYYRKATRFRNMKGTTWTPPPVERVAFRKVEPKETEPMNAVQKTLAMTIARKNGELTDRQIADQHQTIALEMYPHLPVGKALDAFYKTEVGKIALGYAAQTAYSDMQKACACGDAYDVLEKGETEIHHEHQAQHMPGKKKRKAKPRNNVGPGVYGTAPDDAAGPNRPLNWPDNVGKRFASVCDGLAQEHAAQFGVTKDAAYSELLKSNRLFKLLWNTALTLPSE
jgi:hypothetical protein